MTPALLSLKTARRALTIADTIDHLGRHIEELVRIKEHAKLQPVEVELSLPFGAARVSLTGDRTLAVIEAVHLCAVEEQKAGHARLAELGFSYSEPTTGPQAQSEN